MIDFMDPMQVYIVKLWLMLNFVHRAYKRE